MQMTPIDTALTLERAGPANAPLQTEEFQETILELLGADPTRSVSEEELFSAVVAERLSFVKEAHDFFQEQKSHHLAIEGLHEAAARKALEDTVEAGLVDPEAADEIYSLAFQAAQLDDNSDALYDDRGTTSAVAPVPIATLSASDILLRIQDGSLALNSRSLSEVTAISTDASMSSTESFGDGFLWKPVSESDGNLVVLLPTQLRGNVERVELHHDLPPTRESFVETGRFTGDNRNGDRPHFRFDDPGRAYGNNLYVVAYGSTGELKSWRIPHGADRIS